MANVDAMFNTGLYINDLSMHDSSRDLVLAGTQQSAELKLALDQVGPEHLFVYLVTSYFVSASFGDFSIKLHLAVFEDS